MYLPKPHYKVQLLPYLHCPQSTATSSPWRLSPVLDLLYPGGNCPGSVAGGTVLMASLVDPTLTCQTGGKQNKTCNML